VDVQHYLTDQSLVSAAPIYRLTARGEQNDGQYYEMAGQVMSELFLDVTQAVNCNNISCLGPLNSSRLLI
jgi:hypothetical protein